MTGHLHPWEADLAVTVVKRSPRSKKIAYFRRLKPIFCKPVAGTIDLSRAKLEVCIKQDMEIITADWDARLSPSWRNRTPHRSSWIIPPCA